MKRRYYEYKGGAYCLAELERISGISASVIRNRIKNHWPIEAAVDTPMQNDEPEIDPRWQGKDLEIRFMEPIFQVFKEMQPTLGKSYIAHPKNERYKNNKSKMYYTITLESGKPLIVYPSEFEIIAEAANAG